MPEIFDRMLYVGWSDLDANAHMANSAYLDKAVDVRMMYFQEQGFGMGEFVRWHIGPVVMRDEVEYFRELRLVEKVRVTLTLAGISDDASRFRIRNELFREDGTLVARITSTGGWLDLSTRKLTSPPEVLANALRNLARTEDFQPLSSSLK